MYERKHLRSYSEYIVEQDLGMAPADPNAAAAAPKIDVYSVVFMEDNQTGDIKFPDGSSKKDFTTYEVSKPALDEWIQNNVVSTEQREIADSAINIKRDSIRDLVSGSKSAISPEDFGFIERFKNAITSDMLGKRVADTEVVFSPKENEPSTDNIEVTFIKIPKK